MSGDTLDHTLGEIVSRNLHTAKVLERYEIDYYCDGGRSLREAAEEAGADAQKLAAEIAAIDSQSDTDFVSMSIDALIEYIVDTHHAFMKKLLPDISRRFHGIEENGPLPSSMVSLVHAFHEVKADLVTHTATEEKEVFPYINKLYNLSIDESTDNSKLNEVLDEQILQMEKEHVSAKNGVAALKSMTGDFAANNADPAISELIRLLQSLYYDVHLHIHMENNLLHPRAIQLEKSLQ
jgi:regulator of cell morphogenesis and NO signaling